MSSTHIRINTFQASKELIGVCLNEEHLQNTIKSILLLDGVEVFNQKSTVIGESLALSFEVNWLENEKELFKAVKLLDAQLIHIYIFYDQVGEETNRYFQGKKVIAKKNIEDFLVSQNPKEALMYSVNADELLLFKSALKCINKIDGTFKDLFMELVENNEFDFLETLIKRVENINNLGITEEEHSKVLSLLLHNHNLPALTLFTDLGLSIFSIDNDGNNALMIAGLTNCPRRIIIYLLEKGISVIHKNKNGDTPIHFLYKSNTYRDNGLLGLSKRYEEKGADLSELASDGSSLLWHCNEQPLTKSYLVSKGVKLQRPLNVYNSDLKLSTALKHGDEEAFTSFLNEDNVKNERGLLHLAYDLGQKHLLEPLLKCGALPDEKIANRQPLFSQLIDNGEFETAKLLLDFGLDPNSLPKNLIIMALWNEKALSQIPWLIEIGVFPQPAVLHVINDKKLSESQKIKVLRWLIHAGVDLELSSYWNHDISTPLQLSIKLNHNDIVRFLVESGANPNTIPELNGNFGYSPLISAVDKGNSSLTSFLIDSGADINYYSNDSWQTSALYKATLNKSMELIKLLLDSNANMYQEADVPAVRKPIIELAKNSPDVYAVFAEYL